MSAKEMFEQLDYKYLEDYNDCLFRYENKNENPYVYIYFYENKKIEIAPKCELSYKVFRAINKQIEELGWK